MNTLKFKKGDEVKVIAGSHKGKIAKVAQAFPARGAVALEGIGLVKRKVKPSQLNPKGGSKEIHVPIDASKVALVSAAQPAKKQATKIKKDERSKK